MLICGGSPLQKCPVCTREIPADARVCPYCANPVSTEMVGVTMSAAPARPAASTRAIPFGSSSSDSIDQARFTPGTMLAERYRIAGLIGRGGMGEVYRADDLKLRQPVALKFLPEALHGDPRKLERFLHEVRVARQVSHPNVCRVYDIGEADGQHFISMEYVDGEDLAAVLRRMGRPSPEKSLQIARQLCAGLAAAHDKGVLHRDLKPHNIMIDGEGRVRITDFGLAGFAEDFAGKEVMAGTPAYMAPEQLAGRSVSVKSDIYSLGLVLAELFTGKRVFEGANKEQMLRSRTSAPTSLSTLSEGVDPAVERVILRCLEADPASRPSSALAVAAALPGADPLAAALAAGETPSPEMVAAAGEVGGMRPALAFACAVFILAGTLALVPLNRPFVLQRVLPLAKPPAALADRAGEILKNVGHDPATIVDTAQRFAAEYDYFRHVEKTDSSLTRWDRIASIRPSPQVFWYRTSPRPLIPATATDRVQGDDPPLDVTNMAMLKLDTMGRLLALEIVPPQREVESPETEERRPTDWTPLFQEAQIDLATFTPTEPRWTPAYYCDERAAWEGTIPDQPDIPLRIEVGAYRGKPNFFRIVAPWTFPWGMQEVPSSIGEKIGNVTVLGLVSSLVFAGILLARRNLKMRRSDRAGADRLAKFCTVFLFGCWCLVIDHVWEPWPQAERLRIMFGQALIVVAIMWLWYVALEPYARRHWPHSLISWSRVLMGRLRDPLVGRDILVGGVAIVAGGLVSVLLNWSYLLVQQPPKLATPWGYELLFGMRFQIGKFLDPGFVFFALFVLFLLLGLRLLLRRAWMAIAAILLIQVTIGSISASSDEPIISTVVSVLEGTIFWAIMLLVTVRFGLLAIAVYLFLGQIITVPANWGLTGWQSSPAWTALLILVIVIGYGFHTALGGRSLFRDELLDA